MKEKYRILSIVGTVICIAILVVGIIFVANKSKDKVVYATFVNFAGFSGGLEMCIDNELVISRDMVKILPESATAIPQFTIRRSGDSVEETIISNKYTFNSAGEYVLTCRVKSSKDYYRSDTMLIKVVNNPTTSTNLYIAKVFNHYLYVEDEINLSYLIETRCPNVANVVVHCSEHLSYNNSKINVLKAGTATIKVELIYDSVAITDSFTFEVKPKQDNGNVHLVLMDKGQVIPDNTLEVTLSSNNISLEYTISNLDSQAIYCWTDSDKIEVVSFNVPNIVLKPIKTGNLIVYVRVVDYPNIIFEISITIV